MTRSARRTLPRPTRAARLAVLVAGALTELARLTHDGWLLGLAAAAVGTLVAAFVLCPRPTALSLEHLPAPPAQVGVGFRHGLRVVNTGVRRSPAAVAVLAEEGLAPCAVVLPALEPRAVAVVLVERQVVARGVGTSAGALVTVTAPLGLFRRRAVVTGAWELVRRPALVPVDELLLGGADGAASSPTPSRTGTEVHGVRELRPGDGARDVHWRSSARRGRLMVLEREHPVGGLVTVLVVDGAAAPDWESAVSEGASTALALLAQGQRLRLVVTTPQVHALETTDPGEALDWFARLDRPAPPGAHDLASVLRGDVLLVAPAEVANGVGGERVERAAAVVSARVHVLTAATDALC